MPSCCSWAREPKPSEKRSMGPTDWAESTKVQHFAILSNCVWKCGPTHKIPLATLSCYVVHEPRQQCQSLHEDFFIFYFRSTWKLNWSCACVLRSKIRVFLLKSNYWTWLQSLMASMADHNHTQATCKNLATWLTKTSSWMEAKPGRSQLQFNGPGTHSSPPPPLLCLYIPRWVVSVLYQNSEDSLIHIQISRALGWFCCSSLAYLKLMKVYGFGRWACLGFVYPGCSLPFSNSCRGLLE